MAYVSRSENLGQIPANQQIGTVRLADRSASLRPVRKVERVALNALDRRPPTPSSNQRVERATRSTRMADHCSRGR